MGRDGCVDERWKSVAAIFRFRRPAPVTLRKTYAPSLDVTHTLDVPYNVRQRNECEFRLVPHGGQPTNGGAYQVYIRAVSRTQSHKTASGSVSLE